MSTKTVTPEEVKAIRIKMDLTGDQFAKRIGVHRVTVVRWETGESVPRGMALAALLKLKRKHLHPSV